MSRLVEHYEVETRFIVPLKGLDRLISALSAHEFCGSVTWTTTFFGRDLFQAGKVLRISEISQSELNLCLKQKDIGNKCNIRKETSEKLDAGQRTSQLLDLYLNKCTLPSWDTLANIESVGPYPKFMSFSGENRIWRDKNEIEYKLMQVDNDRWPLLLEVETTDAKRKLAVASEPTLLSAADTLAVSQRVCKAEPPTILYRQLFFKIPPQDTLTNTTLFYV